MPQEYMYVFSLLYPCIHVYMDLLPCSNWSQTHIRPMYHFHMYESNQALPRLIDLLVISHEFRLVVHVWWMLSFSSSRT